MAKILVFAIISALLFISINAQPTIYLFYRGIGGNLFEISTTNLTKNLFWGSLIEAPNTFLSLGPAVYPAGTSIDVFYKGNFNTTFYTSVYLFTLGRFFRPLDLSADTGPIETGVSTIDYLKNQYIIFVKPNGELWYYLFITNSAPPKRIPTDILTSATPNAIVFNGELYVFFTERSNVLHYISFDGTTWTRATPAQNVAILESSSAVVYGNVIFVFYQNVAGKLVYNTFDGKTWSHASVIPIPIEISGTSSPSAILVNEYIFAFYVGIDNIIYYVSITPSAGIPGPTGFIESTRAFPASNQPGVVLL